MNDKYDIVGLVIYFFVMAFAIWYISTIEVWTIGTIIACAYLYPGVAFFPLWFGSLLRGKK